MKPILFSLGPFHLYSFGLMVALGVLLSLYGMLRRAKHDGFPPDPNDVYDLVFVTVLVGFLGARLFYVFQNFDWYLQHPLRIFAFWEGGIVFYGGFIGAFAAIVITAKVKQFFILRVFDFLFPFVALSHAFGRMGCFLNGCCYGRLCNLPWAVSFPGIAGTRHPTQLYEAFYNLCLFFYLNARYKKRQFQGEITGLYFVLYGIGRFVIEFWRADNPFLGVLTWNQWLSLFIILAGSLFFAKGKQRPINL
jgi:phosphatidylglycerol:prolipoprotein diacylglycerol transferase